DLIASRIATRAHEFMPVSLLASQFATLEPLQDDEAGRVVPLALTTAEIVDSIGSGVGRASR
ncbi:MAG TPA: gluconokinase, partial [Leifsonia sp.]|nr:gluconokinase [Leifsonia sp.]